MLVDVLSQKLKDNNHMLSKTKGVKHSNHSLFVIGILFIEHLDKLEFNIRIISVKLFISTYLQSNLSAAFFQIDTLHYLAKSPSIDNVTYYIPVPYLLSYSSSVITFVIRHLFESLSSEATYGVDVLELHELCLFKHRQFIHILLESFRGR